MDFADVGLVTRGDEYVVTLDWERNIPIQNVRLKS